MAQGAFDADDHQHMRFNPLRGDWVLVSPHRLKRPWQGKKERPDEKFIPPFDPTNPLSPGVTRPNGKVTPKYEETYVFDNDFPALLPEVPVPDPPSHPLMRSAHAAGKCRVMCFHPRSDITLPLMSVEAIQKVIEEWIRQTEDLGKKFVWVQIFENKGEINGCSNPHPHCQIWATSFLPNEARYEDENMKKYLQEHGKPMLLEYAQVEEKSKERVVIQNDDWIVVVPYWALWPFEVILLPRKRHILRFPDLTSDERKSLASIMKRLLIRYDNLFGCSFPYSMGWHGAPTGPQAEEKDYSHWQFHAHYYPCLLKSATIRKFMVGFELLSQGQRDLTAEKAAEQLRACSEIHYKEEDKKKEEKSKS